MIVVIDNYDSFVHNLARHIRLCGQDTYIARNDKITAYEISALNPLAIVISPGPCTPAQSGNSLDIIHTLGKTIPILGVCLGHQCIGTVYNARVTQALKPVHGKQSPINHAGTGLFKGLPSPFMVGRYHSLNVEIPDTSNLEVTALSFDNIVMAFQHKIHPVCGVQFHPESILTEHGLHMLQNFIDLAKELKNVRMV
jgi:para-aminobenzoate synthetase component II